MKALIWLIAMKENSEVPINAFLDLYPLRTNLKEVECKSVGRKFHFLHPLNPEIFKFKFKFDADDSKRNAMSTRIIDETSLRIYFPM